MRHARETSREGLHDRSGVEGFRSTINLVQDSYIYICHLYMNKKTACTIFVPHKKYYLF